MLDYKVEVLKLDIKAQSRMRVKEWDGNDLGYKICIKATAYPYLINTAAFKKKLGFTIEDVQMNVSVSYV